MNRIEREGRKRAFVPLLFFSIKSYMHSQLPHLQSRSSCPVICWCNIIVRTDCNSDDHRKTRRSYGRNAGHKIYVLLSFFKLITRATSPQHRIEMMMRYLVVMFTNTMTSFWKRSSASAPIHIQDTSKK